MIWVDQAHARLLFSAIYRQSDIAFLDLFKGWTSNRVRWVELLCPDNKSHTLYTNDWRRMITIREHFLIQIGSRISLNGVSQVGTLFHLVQHRTSDRIFDDNDYIRLAASGYSCPASPHSSPWQPWSLLDIAEAGCPHSLSLSIPMSRYDNPRLARTRNCLLGIVERCSERSRWRDDKAMLDRSYYI